VQKSTKKGHKNAKKSTKKCKIAKKRAEESKTVQKVPINAKNC
jgi:hypothetical protein